MDAPVLFLAACRPFFVGAAVAAVASIADDVSVMLSEIVSLLLIGVSQIECGLFRPRRRVSPVRTGWLVGRLALAVGCASEAHGMF